jgi:peptide/nickel transport system permease protein
MRRFLLRRLGRALFTLWAVATFAFVILRLTGDPVRSLLPDTATPEIVAAYTERWGLDRPMPEQYLRYLAALARGDFGRSFRDERPALETVAERLPKTLQLTGTAFLLVLLIGVPSGVAAALRRGSVVDRAVMAAAVAAHSLPSFLLGLAFMLLFAVTWRLLPSSGSSTLAHLVLPALTLGMTGAAVIARFTRAAVLEVMEQPHVRAARAAGHPMGAVIRRDVLPNAAIPLLTVLGFVIGGLVGGSIITETVFAWPGIGRLLATAVAARDLAVVQCIVLLLAAAMVAANLLVDVLYGWLNPRIRVAAAGEAG